MNVLPQLKIAALLCWFQLFLLSTCCPSAEPSKRVAPSQWSQDVLDAFFEDARQQLVGARPKHATASSIQKISSADGGRQADDSGESLKWSTLVDADTLTAEIKRLNYQISQSLRQAMSMVRGTNVAISRDFALMSLLFDVIAEHDQEIRWQPHARNIQVGSIKASDAFRTRSPQRYQIAQDTLANLGKLMSGQIPTAPDNSDDDHKTILVDRKQLMQSMELILKERLAPPISNAKEFRKRSRAAVEQAQLLAVLAEVIQDTRYEYSDDDTYLEETRQLRESARELAKAAQEKNYEGARAAAGEVSQSCSRCHEDYRG